MDIDDLLKTLKDVKSKEETELNEWGKQVNELKTHLNSLIIDVFEDAEK
jgi:hypothetical protein